MIEPGNPQRLRTVQQALTTPLFDLNQAHAAFYLELERIKLHMSSAPQWMAQLLLDKQIKACHEQFQAIKEAGVAWIFIPGIGENVLSDDPMICILYKYGYFDCQ